ncbi:flippase [Aquirufa sp. 2-AUSEE-184A6]|uniref:Flippase n=1 Tax=Aquirufa novilacunae TaxID=3139305 RepID=A0ABW8SUY4_9BACT
MREKIINNISWLFLDKVFRAGVGLFINIYLVRYLGPKQFGLLSFTTALFSLFGPFASFGLKNIVIRNLINEPEKVNETLGTSTLMLFIGGVVTYLICILTICILRPSDTLSISLVILLGTILLFNAGEVSIFWFESQIQSKYIVWVQNIIFFITSIIKFFLIANSASIFAFVWITVIESVFATLILLFLMGYNGVNFLKFKVSLVRARILFKESWPLLLSSIASILNMKIDQVMLGQMVGDEVVGIFSAAIKISEIWYFTIGIVLSSVYPLLSKMHASNNPKIHNYWVNLYRWMFIISLIGAIFLVIFSKLVINLFFGQGYSESAAILKIHAWSGINVAIGSVWSYWILLEGKLKLGLFAQIIGAVLNISLNFILIPYWGAFGAAIATLISYFFSSLVSFTFYKPKIFFGYIKEAILF